MTPNQIKGIYLLTIAVFGYSIPPLVYGIPIPQELVLIYIGLMLPLILGMVLLAKVFD